jgi:hypothetical protein
MPIKTKQKHITQAAIELCQLSSMKVIQVIASLMKHAVHAELTGLLG